MRVAWGVIGLILVSVVSAETMEQWINGIVKRVEKQPYPVEELDALLEPYHAVQVALRELRKINVDRDLLIRTFSIVGDRQFMPEAVVAPTEPPSIYIRYNDTPYPFAGMKSGDVFVRIDGCHSIHDSVCWETFVFSPRNGKLRLITSDLIDDYRHQGYAGMDSVLKAVHELTRMLSAQVGG